MVLMMDVTKTDFERIMRMIEKQEKAAATTARVLAAHDKAQDDFDRIEGINFERRLMRLMDYRMERIESGKIPPS